MIHRFSDCHKSEELERCEKLAEYIISTGCTVRQAANRFGVSKSTVHKDVTERLKSVNRQYYEKVCEILSKNKAERHLRGGIATRIKYDRMKSGRSANEGGHKRAKALDFENNVGYNEDGE